MKWVKAVLKVTPELRWHPGQYGEWESSIVPILSLEIGGATLSGLHTQMNEPSKLLEQARDCADLRRMPFVVRETEVERAREIADEFYPQNRNIVEQSSDRITQSPDNAELCARICELARILGYSAVKIRMIVGLWRQDLIGLERKLQNELDEGPQGGASQSVSERPRRHNRVNGRAFGC